VGQADGKAQTRSDEIEQWHRSWRAKVPVHRLSGDPSAGPSAERRVGLHCHCNRGGLIWQPAPGLTAKSVEKLLSNMFQGIFRGSPTITRATIVDPAPHRAPDGVPIQVRA